MTKTVVIFQYLKNHLTKIIHWPHYRIVTASQKGWEHKNEEIFRNQVIGAQFSQITTMLQMF